MDKDIMIQNMERFVNDAFCVKGTTKFKSWDKLVSQNGQVKDCMTFEVNDSDRGEFYVSLTKDKS